MDERIVFFVFICFVRVCGETGIPAESALQSDMPPLFLQKDSSLTDSSDDLLRPPSPSRKLLSLKGTIKLMDEQTTRKYPITKKHGTKAETSSNKKTANLASQETTSKSFGTQKITESTTEKSTTEYTTEETTTETTTESTTEATTESTTEATTESTTETTTESTTEATTESTTETTTESTTEETTTETTTDSTTEQTTTKATSAVSDKSLTQSSKKLPNATKSWEKYLSKSTPARTGSTHLQNKASSAMPSMSPNYVVQGQSDITVQKDAHIVSDAKPSFGYTQSTLKMSTEKSAFSTGSPTKKQKYSKEYSKTSVTESKRVPSTNRPTTTPSRNYTSMNISIDIDIDINLLSSLNTTSEDSEENSTPTSETPQNREKRYEKKTVVAGVLLVVLVSVSVACAILLVLMPSNYDVRCRRHHQIPDQVALIPSRNKCRPRFYDSSLYMGH